MQAHLFVIIIFFAFVLFCKLVFKTHSFLLLVLFKVLVYYSHHENHTFPIRLFLFLDNHHRAENASEANAVNKDVFQAATNGAGTGGGGDASMLERHSHVS